MTSSRYFKRITTGRRSVQFNLKRYYCGFGVKTWPVTYTGTQKRAVHFGLGYISWRIQ